MNSELEKQLYEQYPKLFKQKRWSIRESCMPWGVECGQGWYAIIDSVCRVIQHHIDSQRHQRSIALRYNRALKRAIAGNTNDLVTYYKRLYSSEELVNKRLEEEIRNCKFRPVPDTTPQIQFTQIKEKFGGLRLYTNFSNEYIDGAISMAMQMSHKTCEVCGKTGKLRGIGWRYTACDEHTDPDHKEDDET